MKYSVIKTYAEESTLCAALEASLFKHQMKAASLLSYSSRAQFNYSIHGSLALLQDDWGGRGGGGDAQLRLCTSWCVTSLEDFWATCS